MQHCAAVAAVPPAIFKDESLVQRTMLVDGWMCVYLSGWLHFQTTQWSYLSQSHPAFCAVQQDSQILNVLYSLCSSTQT